MSIIYIILSIALVGCFLFAKMENTHMIRQVKKRKADGHLPDYRQIELLRLGLAERYTRSNAGVLLPSNAERMMPQERMDALRQHIADNDYEASWSIVDNMISEYEKGVFVIIAGILSMAVVIFVIFKFCL